jgi:acetyl-CoA C-acetyltransferase
MNFLPRTPVIIGVGEVVDRPEFVDHAKEPLVLMAEALRRASEDSGAPILREVESLDVVNSTSWGYANLPRQLSCMLGISPKRQEYGEIGGDTPVRYIHDAAVRVAQGELECAAVCGAESAQSVFAAEKSRKRLPWIEGSPKPSRPKREGIIHPLALRFGLDRPLTVYPLYEYATRASWHQNFAEAQAETGEIYSQFSGVAQENVYAWDRRFYTPSDILTPSSDNRLVSGPYTKRMVANPRVNQGAAVIVTSFAKAKAIGILEERLVYVWGGAAAHEHADFVSRSQYKRSLAMETALNAAKELCSANQRELELVELYSCFPCIPKMARRIVDWPLLKSATITGGLSFFGGPYNNYMTHAAAAMTRELRRRKQHVGLLYGLGGFATKHHSLILASTPPVSQVRPGYLLAASGGHFSGEVPRIDESFVGDARLETYTVLYDREGTADRAVVFARTDDQSRVLAQVDRSNARTLDLLTSSSANMIGQVGRISLNADRTLNWQF